MLGKRKTIQSDQNVLAETGQLSGRDLFFAWYNLASSQLAMADDAPAAQAYDQAFSIYAGLEEGERPWRSLNAWVLMTLDGVQVLV
ncbi:MAG: hypothetical protein MUO62_02600 [Anaerolineales bacterium]|nr:hypothetical protein [Anaerolineales bacterium]